MDIKQKYREETDLDVYPKGILGADASFSNEYVKWLEAKLTLTDVFNCNCDQSKQLEEEFEINHLINDTYQVVGKDSSTVWKQGTMEECNDWVML